METLKKMDNSLKNNLKISPIEINEIRYLLLNLGLSTRGEGGKYLIAAILNCYYSPEYFTKLDDILKIVGDEFNIPTENVRSKIRSRLSTFNNSYNYNEHELYFKIFIFKQKITPKVFLEYFTLYLDSIKGNERILF